MASIKFVKICLKLQRRFKVIYTVVVTGRLFIKLCMEDCSSYFAFRFKRRRKASISEKRKEMRFIANGKAKGNILTPVFNTRNFYMQQILWVVVWLVLPIKSEVRHEGFNQIKVSLLGTFICYFPYMVPFSEVF
jgi:hypothetical protein